MKILTVSPIQKTALRKDFSYFTNLEIFNVGDIVEVPIKTKKVPAIVLKIKNVKDAKTNLRTQGFTLKKLGDVNSKKILTESFIKTTNEVSKFFIGTQGQVVNQFSPKNFISNYVNLSGQTIIGKTKVPNKKNKNEVLITDKNTRIKFYKKLIEKKLKENKSVFFYAPTTEALDCFYKKININTEKRFFKFHSKISKKILEKNISKCLLEKKSVAIFATSNFSSLPRNDIDTFVIENFSDEEIKISKPFTNVQKFFEIFAKNSNAKILFGNSFFTPKILSKVIKKEAELIKVKNNKQKIKISIFDQKYKKAKNSKSPTHDLRKYLFLNKQVIERLQKLNANKEKGLVLVARKGIASYTACVDCGTSVQCQECHSPLALKKREGSNKFFCSRCNKFFITEVRCLICNSWNLKSYGVGLDKIKKEIENNIPEINIFPFSKDHLKTEAQAKRVLGQFSDSESSILLGTDMIFSHFEETVPYSLIVSNDSLFYISNYKNEERYFNQVMKLVERTTEKIDIQTRCSEKPLFEHIEKMDSKSFSKSELSLRKSLGYPPHKIIIKLDLRGKREKIIKDNDYIRGVLYKYSPETVSGKQFGVSEYSVTTYITVNPESWPDEKLSAILYSLPSSVTIRVST